MISTYGRLLLCCLLPLGGVSTAAGRGAAPPQPISGPVIEAPPPEAANQGREVYPGNVTAVDKESVTIVCGARRVETIGTLPDGTAFIKKVAIWPEQPPRKFTATEALAAGANKPYWGASYSYRLSDVRVGDYVYVSYIRIDGKDMAEELCIWRRPGGLVPPAPGEKPDEPRKWHDRQNALEVFRTVLVPSLSSILPRLTLAP